MLAVRQSKRRRLCDDTVSKSHLLHVLLSITCLDNLQVAVLRGINVVRDVQARAVVMVEGFASALQPRLCIALLSLVLVLQPGVAEQELGSKCLLKPTRKTCGHVTPVGVVGGRRDLTRLPVGLSSEVETGQQGVVGGVSGAAQQNKRNREPCLHRSSAKSAPSPPSSA